MRVSLPVTEILNTVRPPMWDGDWESYFAVYHEDPLEWERVETLALEIMERGQLEAGRIDYDEDDGLYLGNGNHRFYATVLLGLETFDVTYGLKWDEESIVPKYYLSTKVALTTDYSRNTELDDKVFDTLCSTLNFRLNDEVWVEFESTFSTSGGLGVEYEFMFTHVPDKHVEAFAEQVLARVSQVLDPKRIKYFSVNQEFMFNEDATVNPLPFDSAAR